MALIEDKPFAQSLSGEAGYRYSDYSLDFTTDTYKLGMEWTPIEDIRARASYQRSVRVPNVDELFGVQALGLDGTVDCLRATCRRARRRADGRAMRAHGRELRPSTATFDPNPAAQYNGFVGGNPDLQPETADTLSFGLAFQPSFLPGLRLQLDYFDISIEDAIQNPNADFTVLMCALTPIRSPARASCVTLDGSLWQYRTMASSSTRSRTSARSTPRASTSTRLMRSTSALPAGSASTSSAPARRAGVHAAAGRDLRLRPACTAASAACPRRSGATSSTRPGARRGRAST